MLKLQRNPIDRIPKASNNVLDFSRGQSTVELRTQILQESF